MIDPMLVSFLGATASDVGRVVQLVKKVRAFDIDS